MTIRQSGHPWPFQPKNLKSEAEKTVGHFVARNSKIAIIQDLLLNNVFQRDTWSHLILPIISIF